MQTVADPVQVAQFASHALQILLSEMSPYSLIFVQLSSHFLVKLFPHLGEGHAAMHIEPLR